MLTINNNERVLDNRIKSGQTVRNKRSNSSPKPIFHKRGGRQGNFVSEKQIKSVRSKLNKDNFLIACALMAIIFPFAVRFAM